MNQEAIKRRREIFLPGTRVVAEGFSGGSINDNKSVPPGSEGVVQLVDDTGTVHVAWDNGSSLGVLLCDRLRTAA